MSFFLAIRWIFAVRLSLLMSDLIKKMLNTRAVYRMCDLFSTKKKHKGGILIEFTFCIPLCIILLFFVNDHYRFYELKNKIKNSAYLAASMIQNLGNTRTDKQLTTSDIGRISLASCLNLFHTNAMFNPWPLGIYYVVDYRYVKRVDANSYQYQHSWASFAVGTTPKDMNNGVDSIYTKDAGQIQRTNLDLICYNNGEERLEIQVCYRYKKNFDKSKLGFLFMTPKAINSNLLEYKFVITPKPGLFPMVNK